MYTICKNVCNQVSVTNIVVQECTDSTDMVIREFTVSNASFSQTAMDMKYKVSKLQ